MPRNLLTAALSATGGAALALVVIAAPALAQQGGAGRPAAPMAGVSKDPAAAPAGNYKLDPNHTSVIARLAHGGGFSYSTFRFGDVKGTLAWDPAKPEANRLNVSVAPKSIMSPVQGFSDELGGERFLNTAKYPDATFVSTAFHRTGPNRATVDGNLTFMGVTKPITIDAELVGAGKNMRGVPTLGVTGRAHFKRSDFGFTAMNGPIGDEIELMLDAEFDQA